MALDNATILDKVRIHSSNDYQQRVPEANQVGLDRIADIFESDETLFNLFHENLVNLIGTQIVRDVTWNNPLAVFKRDNLRMGQHIQEIAVGLLKANGYDMRDNNVFQRNPAEVYAKVHTLNRRVRYDLTINPELVMQAMRSEDGLNNLLARELASAGLSDEYDEFQVMKHLIAQAFVADELYKVNAPFANPLAPTTEELKSLSVAIRTMAGKVRFLTTIYSAEGIPTVSDPSNLVLIVTPETQAALDVNVLADAFHIDRTDFAQQIIVIDEFPMVGIHAMLVDKNWFVCADKFKLMNSFYNAKSLETNFYLHHHGLYSTSPFVNAIVFGDFPTDSVPVVTVTLDSLDAAVVDEDGDTVTTFSYGDELRLEVTTSATVAPDNSAFIAPSGWNAEISITDDEDEPIAKTVKTSYTVNGDLRIQEGLSAGDKVTIKVTSTYVDPSGDGSAPVTPLTDTVVLTVA